MRRVVGCGARFGLWQRTPPAEGCQLFPGIELAGLKHVLIAVRGTAHIPLLSSSSTNGYIVIIFVISVIV